MDIRVEQTDCTEFETPLLVVKIFEDGGELVGPVSSVDERLGGRIREVMERGDFRGREGQTLLLYPDRGSIPAERVLLVGLGKSGKLDAERIRRASATAARQAGKLGVTASPRSCTTPSSSPTAWIWPTPPVRSRKARSWPTTASTR
jgi:leucyl aminopeptidase